MTYEEAAQVLAYVAARYPASKLFEQDAQLTTQMWHMSLEDVPYDLAEKFLVRWFRSEKWAPDPSEIRLAVGAELLGLPPVEEAWGMALSAAAAWDSKRLPRAMKVAIEAIGGLYTLKTSDRPDRLREAFVAAYTVERKNVLETTTLDAIDRGDDLLALG